MKEATTGGEPVVDIPIYENLNAEAPATKADIMRLMGRKMAKKRQKSALNSPSSREEKSLLSMLQI
jgi:hypothetical protein